MEQSLRLVRQLVHDFASQEAAYLADSYSESQARLDFIDKFFTALGWDVSHQRQKNPYEQEVKIERPVKTDVSARKADYAFFIAPNFRDVKFFAEAKKPAKLLNHPDYYYQTIRYGWNKGTPIAVLTDFEELHILDCRYKPDMKTVLDQRIMKFHYKEYADEKKFAEIFYLLGRNAVAEGSLEKFAATLPKPRGKAIQRGLFKGGYQPVDEAFLGQLDGYRETLAKAFKKENQELEGEELTEAVQRTLDRLVFIRFLEDKSIEEPSIINLRTKKSAWNAFLALCRSLEPKYNGLVFKPHRIIDGTGFHPPDDVLFADICDELADPSTPYDFDKIPISILGSIYERFLGKVVHATAKRVTVEDKPEVRKAGGVYYTPEYIVRYIVKETVGKLIEGKTPEQIAEMAFADIACGSGSFLIEVYDLLLEYHTRYYAENPKKARKGETETREGKTVLSLKKRQEILTNSIYGVDIDFQATEVTQLSLYLKLLEDVTKYDAHQFSMLKEKILPDLRNNIVSGNSLVERDRLEKNLFEDEKEDEQKPMNFVDVFPRVIKRGGFDVVLGNPPYVRQESLGNQFKEYAKRNYSVFDSSADLYVYFFEKAHRILKAGSGLFGMICSNKFIRTKYGRPLRQFLSTRTTIRKVIDFGELPIFSKAATFPAIFLTKNISTKKQEFEYVAIKQLKFESLEAEIGKRKTILNDESISGDNWSLVGTNQIAIIEKMKKTGIPLGTYVGDEIYRGILTGLNEAFVINDEIKEMLLGEDKQNAQFFKPFVIGDDVRKYAVNVRDRHLVLIPKGWTKLNMGKEKKPWEWFSKNHESLAKYLSQFEIKAKKRLDKGDFWWELRACDYYEQFELTKIVYPEIAKESRFALDKKGFYLNKTCFFIPRADLYLLGVLNSKLVWLFLKSVCSVLGDAEKGGRLLQQLIYVKQIPIHSDLMSSRGDKSRHDHIVKLVEQMLAAKEKLAEAKTDAEVNRLELHCNSLARQIDEAVYELYGLTEEEIKIVEG